MKKSDLIKKLHEIQKEKDLKCLICLHTALVNVLRLKKTEWF